MSLLSKAYQALGNVRRGGSRGSLSDYVPNSPHEYGQPLRQSLDPENKSIITPRRMREITRKTPTAAACVNAILDYASSVPIKVRNIDPSKPADNSRVEYVLDLIGRPNERDTQNHFFYQLARDILSIGYGALEIEPDRSGKPANLHVLDAVKFRIDFAENGEILGYDMLNAQGMPIAGPDGTHAWNPDEVILFRHKPDSSNIYPSSTTEQIFACALIESMLLAFIGHKFDESNIPFGVLDLGDVSEEELELAVEKWNQQAQNNHRIILTGSKGGTRWQEFGYHLKDLEPKDLLAALRSMIMGIYGVTANELGESQDINKSNGYNLAFTFKKRALEPLLNEIAQTLTRRLLWDVLGYTDLELYYDEIDSRDELLRGQIHELYLKLGIISINAVRNELGDPSIAGGDEPMMFTGSAWIPVSMLRNFAEAQLETLQAANAQVWMSIQQAQVAQQATVEGSIAAPAAQSMITPPRTRPPKIPDGFGLPDGAGATSTRLKYPQAKLDSPSKPVETPQKPRGSVQAARNVGLRKENM